MVGLVVAIAHTLGCGGTGSSGQPSGAHAWPRQLPHGAPGRDSRGRAVHHGHKGSREGHRYREALPCRRRSRKPLAIRPPRVPTPPLPAAAVSGIGHTPIGRHPPVSAPAEMSALPRAPAGPRGVRPPQIPPHPVRGPPSVGDGQPPRSVPQPRAGGGGRPAAPRRRRRGPPPPPLGRGLPAERAATRRRRRTSAPGSGRSGGTGGTHPRRPPARRPHRPPRRPLPMPLCRSPAP